MVAAFLSTRDGFFPVPENPITLFILWGTVEILVFLLLDKLSDWRRCRPFMRQVYKRVPYLNRCKQGVDPQAGESFKEEEV
jgi:hypothetical protein